MNKKPKEFVPAWSQNFIVGYSFLHHALDAVGRAFLGEDSLDEDDEEDEE